MSAIADTQALAASHGLEFRDLGNGHVQIIGHGVLVNYWPLSKRRTAHRVGAQPVANCTPWDAVKLAITTGESVSLKPPIARKVARQPNGPQGVGDIYTSNPAGVRHFYRGSRPPWEFPALVMSEPDRIRVEAYLAHSAAIARAASLDDEVAA